MKTIRDAATLWGRISPRLRCVGACMEWTGATSNKGYGMVNARGSLFLVHRVSYAANRGVPDGFFVLHRCDNPRCVNPDHLFLGTNSDNMKDAFAKGRGVIPHHVGAAHPNAKIMPETVREIRRLRGMKWTEVATARALGTTKRIVNSVSSGQTWKHVT